MVGTGAAEVHRGVQGHDRHQSWHGKEKAVNQIAPYSVYSALILIRAHWIMLELLACEQVQGNGKGVWFSYAAIAMAKGRGGGL